MSQNGISGWSANGWCTSGGATASIAVANGGTVTLSSNATYYGRYSQTITLSYNGNGATGGSTASQTGTRYYNSGNYSNPSFTIRGNGFSRSNASFKNWALNSTSGTRYNGGASITLSANATLYAKWNVTSTVSDSITLSQTTIQNTSQWDYIEVPFQNISSGSSRGTMTLSNGKLYVNSYLNSLNITANFNMSIPGANSSGDRTRGKFYIVVNGNRGASVSYDTWRYTNGGQTETVSFSLSNISAGTSISIECCQEGSVSARFLHGGTLTATASSTTTIEK